MNKKNSLLLFITLLFFSCVNAQLAASFLSSKEYSSSGGGIFLNVGVFRITKSDMVTFEADAEYFNHAVIAPLLLTGYRHMFNGKGVGLYAEPQVSYTFGAADVPTTHYSESRGERTTVTEPDLSGITSGLVFGYIFPGRLALNLGLRYEHIFVAGDPQVNMLTLRFTHTIICGGARPRS